jgi:hypothetical protein
MRFIEENTDIHVPKLYGLLKSTGPYMYFLHVEYSEGVSMPGLSETEKGVVKVETLRHSETLRGIQSGRIGAGVFGSWLSRPDGR